MKISFLMLLILTGFIICVICNYAITQRLENPESFAKYIKQKEVDCNICLESQYQPCNAPNKYCWILIDNIHQTCYQNCTIPTEN